MGTVHASLGMSLDGFVAGPNAGPNNPLGDGGMRIHRWVYDLEGWRERQSLQGGKTNPDDEVSKETYARTGAFVMGRRMFDEGEVGWPDPPPFRAPVFVLLPTAPGNRGSGREGPPSRSSPTVSRAPWSKRGRPRARRTSWYPAARTRSGSSWRLGCSTSCRSTSPPCCSARESGCSGVSTPKASSWSPRG
jgi:hypothetical protein